MLNLWRLINQPVEHAERYPSDPAALRRLIRRYYVQQHWPTLLLVIAIGSTAGLVVFAYAAMGRFIADDVIEVHLLAQDDPVAHSVDPTMPGEHRRYSLEQPDRQNTAWVARLDAKPGRSIDDKMSLLWRLAAVMLLMELARHAAQAIVLERTIYLGGKVQYRLRQHLHDKLHELPLSYHDRHSPGRLMTHLFSDVGAFQQHMTELLRNLPPSLLTMAFGMTLLMAIAPDLAMLVLVALPTYAVCYNWFRKRIRRVHENLRTREGMLNAHVANRVSSFQVIKSFGRETGESLQFLQQARVILRQHLGTSLLDTGFVVLCGVISGTCMTVLLWVGTLRVRDGAMSLGTLLMFYAAAGYLFTPIATLTNLAAHLQRLRVVAGKVMRVLDEPVTLADPEQPVMPPRRACELRFDNVSLRYGEDRTPALEGVTFTLPAGKRLAVMGPSGSGKSTLAKLACRLYDPTAGCVSYDGIDLRQIKVAALRRYVGFVAQEPVVFSGTIAENIGYGSPTAGPRDMVASARYAQIHDFIEQLPQRYRTLTHERGLTLSGGQKQRVGLARSLLAGTPVLVLDDCTSALDAHTEARLMDGFAAALANRTVLLITHRVSIALVCDLVLMLDDGRVAEFGPPHELARGDGPFAALCREQQERSRTPRLQLSA
jgi:ABC-type multidrug transport system fused ATPase/permease subunit